MARSDIGMGLNPSAPDLALSSVQARTDGEIFWIASQGIRMTGMPAFSATHGEDDLWKIVAFVRHLPRLSGEDRAALEAWGERSEHPHH